MMGGFNWSMKVLISWRGRIFLIKGKIGVLSLSYLL